MKHSEQLNELFTALNKAQAEIGTASKSSSGHNIKYADLAEILRVIETPFKNNGLSHMQMPSISNGQASLVTLIGHTSGQWISEEALMAHCKLSRGNDAQMMGATIAYQRRYSLKSFLGIAEMDEESAMADTQNKAVRAIEEASPVATDAKVVQLTALLAENKVNLTAFLAKKKMITLGEIKADLADQMIAHYSKEADK